jgi:hypothetical protein
MYFKDPVRGERQRERERRHALFVPYRVIADSDFLFV